MRGRPKLRTVEKYNPPYPLNKFPSKFAINLGKEVIYLLSTRGTPRLEGSDWEEIFSRLIGAKWKPSNVGLDDVVLQQTAWGTKTVKARSPINVSKIRLISGRNSVSYSFGDEKIINVEPNGLGSKILDIYNERVAAVRQLYQHTRTAVLLKSNDLLELAVFEVDAVMYEAKHYEWRWNERSNLEGLDRSDGRHKFTWQPHGSQFTIIQDVPDDRLAIRIRKPPLLEREKVLQTFDFDDSWIEVLGG